MGCQQTFKPFAQRVSHATQIAFLGGCLLWGSKVGAATFIVNDPADSTSVRSLRGAILAANATPDRFHVIFLTEPTYKLSLEGIDEDRGRTGDLDISCPNLTIIGRREKTTINGSDLGDRILQVHPGAKVVLRQLVFYGGKAFGGDYANSSHVDGEAGGAIYNAGNLTLRDCNLMGNTSGAGGVLLGNGPGGVGGPGGGIYNRAVLTLERCLLRGNSSGPATVSSFGGAGGAVYNDETGTCVLTDCNFDANSSGAAGPASIGDGSGGTGGDGGALFNAGKMLVRGCTITGNHTAAGTDGILPGWVGPFSLGGPGGKAGNGAGIFNSGRLRVVLSTVSRNFGGSGGNGGNAYMGGPGGIGGSGAGIYNSGRLSLDSCTLCENRCGPGGAPGINFFASGSFPGTGGSGGGVMSLESGVVQLRNTLIARNAYGPGGAPLPQTNGLPPAPDGQGSDLFGQFTSQGYNLIGKVDGSTGVAAGTNGDQAGSASEPIDPLLGPLAENGGRTPTHALLPGSPAIDSGKSFGRRKDQRGSQRPYDFKTTPKAPGGDKADIGSFELHPYD